MKSGGETSQASYTQPASRMYYLLMRPGLTAMSIVIYIDVSLVNKKSAAYDASDHAPSLDTLHCKELLGISTELDL